MWESFSVHATGPTSVVVNHKQRCNLLVLTPLQFATWRNGGTVYVPTIGGRFQSTSVPISGAGSWVIVADYNVV